MMVVSGMCYAAGDGSDLNRQQKVADKFMAVLSGDAAAVTQLQVCLLYTSTFYHASVDI